MVGPQVPFSDEIHASKYRGKGEDFRTAMNRIAGHLSDNHEHFEQCQNVLQPMAFLPAGRVQASAGSTRQICAHNCFVSGEILDSFVGELELNAEDGKVNIDKVEGSIMWRALEAAATMRKGGGIGYDFSTLRPRGDLIKTLDSQASGPLSFMEIYQAVCLCVASAGHRRGAQMGVLRIDHPDIEEFVRAKTGSGRFEGFNLSVAVTDEFMECLLEDRPFNLTFEGRVYQTVDPKVLWEQIMHATYDWAEPGVLFIDTINRMNNLWYCEEIVATNPCGEQPLPPYGACLLGSFNLTQYLIRLNDGSYTFNWEKFKADIPPVVRMMDNVIDRTIYPLPQQEAEAKQKRRMGLGVTGVANAIEAMGHPYGSMDFAVELELILKTLANEAYRASAALALEKGSFPLYDETQYLESEFLDILDPEVRGLIRENGIRNSHLLSIAPTGTISLSADNVSSGIEPVFSYSFDRTVKEFDGERIEKVEDYGVRVLDVEGKRAKDVSIEEHITVLSVATKWVDSAVSKTCNVPEDIEWEAFKNIYVAAWEQGCKGCTTFRDGGKLGGILNESDDEGAEPEETEEAGAACYIDPVTGRHECE